MQGCPVLVIRMKYHVVGLATADENLRYLLYMIEKGVNLAKQASITLSYFRNLPDISYLRSKIDGRVG